MADTHLLVKQYMERLIAFFQPLLPLANCHMVDFFSRSAYMHYISSSLRKELEFCGLKNAIDNIFCNNCSEMPILQAYMDNCKKFTLKNYPDICLQGQALNEKLESYGCKNVDTLKLKVFMTSKKSHEVEILSSVVAALNQAVGASHLIDIGDGKGYLSSLLAFHYDFKVLGIDASDVNTEGAIKRATKLSKQWKNIANPSNKRAEPKLSDNANFNMYKQVTRYIDETVDLVELINNVFLHKPSKLGIVGLHTCGNLAPTSIKLYHKNNDVKSLCNVSCCYHFLTEKYEIESNDELRDSEFGFPISKFLNERSFTIGRRARMIAAQSFDRTINHKLLPNTNIFYRAVLQVILEEHCKNLPDKNVGKIKKCSNFIEYIRQALVILGLESEIKLTDEEINAYYARFYDKIDELYVFYLIRSMLSSVVETIILLDRLLYLLDNGYDNSFLVQLFDPVISPRCYGLISIK